MCLFEKGIQSENTMEEKILLMKAKRSFQVSLVRTSESRGTKTLLVNRQGLKERKAVPRTWIRHRSLY
jgi:hypothetical protein